MREEFSERGSTIRLPHYCRRNTAQPAPAAWPPSLRCHRGETRWADVRLRPLFLRSEPHRPFRQDNGALRITDV